MRALTVLLTLGCSLLAVAPAFAQDEATAPVDVASDPAAEGKQSNAVDDIIVTARRREESLQAVPIAVTVLTPETLREQNVTNTMDLACVSNRKMMIVRVYGTLMEVSATSGPKRISFERSLKI